MTRALTVTVTIPWEIQRMLSEAGVSDDLIVQVYTYFVEEYVNDPFGGLNEQFEEWLGSFETLPGEGDHELINEVYTTYQTYINNN